MTTPGKYAKEVIKEGKRVRWPKREQLVPMIIVVIAITAFAAIFLSLEDLTAASMISQLKAAFGEPFGVSPCLFGTYSGKNEHMRAVGAGVFLRLGSTGGERDGIKNLVHGSFVLPGISGDIISSENKPCQ